jgi:NAD(P)-dependent dehydrogenase (short-subunit alcohol dehydrogenase family)
MIDLTGRVIVVTGAGGGIGSGITRRLAEAGATVVAHTRTAPLDDLMDDLSELISRHPRARPPSSRLRSAIMAVSTGW